MIEDALRWGAKRARATAGRLLHPGAAGVPPWHLRARVGAPEAAGYVASGEAAAGELEAALGRPLASAASVLDLGCGAGRVLRAVRLRAPAGRLVGCDVDAEAIGWATRHLPDVAWAVNGFRPPLPFPDANFAVVYAVSLFSHLDDADQDAWLAEVARVLEPGGAALLSVHGPHAFEQFRTGAVVTRWCPPGAFDRAPLAPEEFVYEPYARSRWNAADLPGIEGSFGVAFHGPDHVRERWRAAGLEVADIVPRGMSAWQDLVVAHRVA